ASSAQSRSAQARGTRRWPPVIALSAAAAVSAGLWVAVVAAVRALL
ncbi:hypothetical protein G3573_21290, partial [Caulobacter sp. 17J65-9]|nr:hypothetical protein [Caulobacter sp. 17J65-9]